MNAKHQEFVNEYIACHGNGTDAYRRVYPNSSHESARREASRLLTNVDISTEIQKRLDENAMGANEVLARLAEHARGDLGDYLDDKGNIVLVGAQTRLLKKVTTRRVVRSKGQDETEEDTTVSIELYDAQSALEKLGRHHKLFTDKVEHDLSEKVMGSAAALIAAMREGANVDRSSGE
jgi:phage terminase small subunit